MSAGSNNGANERTEGLQVDENKVMTTPIAVIGMASILPKAKNLSGYWDNILKKIDCVSDVPESRWSIADYYDPNPAAPDKSYCKRGGFIPDIDFDPLEFGLPPNILEVTDVSQLLGLVVARDALDDAGYSEARGYSHEKTGVILGVVGMSSKLFQPLMSRLQYPIWEKTLRASGVSAEDTQKIINKIKTAYVGWEENSFPGAIGNVVAGRIANRFDLGGTNCVVDAACGSSLAAVRLAVGELVMGRSDMMITGGVDTDNSIVTYLCFSKTPAFSKKDNLRPFDAESDGMMVGEGIGMLVLKRLADAERDGDRVYAVIKGVGSSSDGRFKSIYAPRAEGQARALRRAYAEAGFPAESIGLAEAHGTGTMAGDPEEVKSLRSVVSKDGGRKHIALGSVKSQIGHTKATAGAAGLIKVALALHHKVLPATINVTKPSPKLELDGTPIYVNTETRPWIRPADGSPRRAGVSSFGFGGTNYHIVVEEYKPEHEDAYRINHTAAQVLLAAGDAAALKAACQDWLNKLQGEVSAAQFAALAETSRKLQVPSAQARVGFVAESAEEAAQLLQVCITTLGEKASAESWENPKGIYYRSSAMETAGKVVALFPGQGSQYVEMGRDVAVNFPPVREAFHEMDALFAQDGLDPLSDVIFPAPVFDAAAKDKLSETLQRTNHAQPAIGTFSIGLYRLMKQAGFQADFTAGHSFGELPALCAAGVLSEADCFVLSKARGKAMAPPDDPNFDAGTMLAVKGDVDKIREAIKAFPEITLANWNSNNQVVLAGAKPEIAKVKDALAAQGFSVVPLQVAAAFHTPLVGHAQKPFAAVLETVTFNKPSIQVFSNTTGKAYSDDPKAIRKILAGHILNPVLFKDEIEQIYAAGGRVFVEIGPKNVLTNLVDNILADKPHIAVALNASPKKDSDRQLREAVIQLRVAGLPLTTFDPYALPPKAAALKKKSPATIKLNGGSYVTEKTRGAFQKALEEKTEIKKVESREEVSSQSQKVDIQPQATTQLKIESAPVDYSPLSPLSSPSIDPSLVDRFYSHQSESVDLHEQYLRTEEEYARAFARMTQLQSDLVAKAAAGQLQDVLPLFQSLERSMAKFHEHQAETLRVHEHYLSTQDSMDQSLMKMVGGGQTGIGQPGISKLVVPAVPAPMVQAPVVQAPIPQSPIPTTPTVPVQPAVPAPKVTPAIVPAPVAQSPSNQSLISQSQITTSLLAVVSEKTGYPVETLEPDMDMESDLGIDSIKRVEILGAMQAQYPELPKPDATTLAELRTLKQVGDYLGGGQQVSSSPAATSPVVPSVSSPIDPSPITSSSLDQAQITASLLAIVSEKTGYPVETLEPEMDMESDLGIDSIKRVEILGAMQVQYPELPKPDATTLAELRTLKQVGDYLGGGNTENRPIESSPSVGTGQEIPQPSNSSPLSTPATLSPAVITHALFAVVSDKTGYPVETLEPEMDMESDLGIDSIKRVEILGAMQAQYPDLPRPDAATLAELRTLKQVGDYLGAGGTENRQTENSPEHSSPLSTLSSPESEPPFVDAAWIDPAAQAALELPRGVVITKALPAADRLEFAFPQGHTCLITDDGGPLTVGLAQALQSRGWPVVVLSLPADIVPTWTDLPEGTRRVALEDTSETHLQQKLAEASRMYGPAAMFIHIAPARDASASNENGASGASSAPAFLDAEKAILKEVFLIAKHLKEDLNRASQSGRAAFVTVTRLDGQFGLGTQGEFTPVIGGLTGLVKTLNLEWEPVFCRAVDLDPALEVEKSVDCLLAELSDPNRLVTEVGYGPQGRCTLVVRAPETTAN